MFRFSQNNRLKLRRETNSDDVTKILIDSRRSRSEDVTVRIRMDPNSRSRLDSPQTRQQLTRETEISNHERDRERRDEKISMKNNRVFLTYIKWSAGSVSGLDGNTRPIELTEETQRESLRRESCDLEVMQSRLFVLDDEVKRNRFTRVWLSKSNVVTIRSMSSRGIFIWLRCFSSIFAFIENRDRTPWI